MKFNRVGNKIRCIISKEEMEENGIELGDFVSDQEKTQKFIRLVLQEACESLGIEDNATAYSVQMAVMPGGDVALLITPDNTGLAAAIEELKRHLTGLQQDLADDDEPMGLAPVKKTTKRVALDSADKLKEVGDDEVTDQYKDTPLWVVLPSLDSAIDLSKRMPDAKGIESALYKFSDNYYLKLNFQLSRKQISYLILVISEYSISMFTEAFNGAFILEHGQLICKDCLRKLGEL